MDFYQSLGYLVIGSRMRRLSDYLIAEINKVYQEEEMGFDASWFPLFFILGQEQEVSIRQLADRIQVSHSAVSQLVSNLKKKGLVQSNTATGDARVQMIRFTPKGVCMLEKIKPVWEGLTRVMENLECSHPEAASVLTGITAMESAFEDKNLKDRIQGELHHENSTT